MEITQYITDYGLQLFVVGLIFGLGFSTWYLYEIMQKTFGIKYLRALLTAKRLGNKGFLVLEIKHRTGSREYKVVKQSSYIKYQYKENEQIKEKGVFYDPKAVDYISGIPVLSCSTYSFLPLERETGLSVYIPPEVLDKLARDNAMDYETKEKYDKLMKSMAWAGAGVLICVLLLVSYMYGNVSDLTAQLIAAERALAQSATIVGN